MCHSKLRLGAGSSFGLALFGVLSLHTNAVADEGGVSFWIPGFYGSLASAPVASGWALTTMEYYDSVRAGGDVALARNVTIRAGDTTFNARLQASIEASLKSTIEIGMLIPTYTFEQRLLGAQVTVGMITGLGYVDTNLQGQIAGNLGPFGFERFGSITDKVTAPTDLIPIVPRCAGTLASTIHALRHRRSPGRTI